MVSTSKFTLLMLGAGMPTVALKINGKVIIVHVHIVMGFTLME